MMWHILTGEYPPQRGGVSDYTRQVACGLASRGDDVVVWAPPTDGAADPVDRGVALHRLPGCFGWRSLRQLTRELDRSPSPHRVLVQYVPHAFGWKGANLPFCLWIASRRRDPVWVMFHEVSFPFDLHQSASRNALAAVNRVMARLVARAAGRIFVSIPGWRPMLASLVGRGAAVEWLPVPSGIPTIADPVASASVRAGVGNGRAIVGHFGTHGRAIRELFVAAAARLLRRTDCAIAIIGPGGEKLRRDLMAVDTAFGSRIQASGPLSEREVSAHIAACDVMLQPYPDGISTRRTSAMAALAHGIPVVTTVGWLTEPLWDDSEAVAIAPVDDPSALAREVERLLASCDLRAQLGGRGRELYHAQFDVRHTIDALRRTSDATHAPAAACA